MKIFPVLLLLCLPIVSCQKKEVEKVAPVEVKERVKLQAVTPRNLKLIEAARWQIDKTVSYNPAYVGLEYPNGDIPIARGVCTDVVIRAFRKGLGVDLQKRVHEDMSEVFSEYPNNWDLTRPDKNIDHRRVPNLKTYFKRLGWTKPITNEAKDYQAGDIVVSHVAGRRPHIMIVSERLSEDGVPLVIHNIGRGTVERDHLFSHPIKAHFRIAEHFE